MTSRTAKVDKTFHETPSKGSSMIPPANAVIIPTVTQKATIGLRNRIRTSITITAPSSADSEISFMRA